MIPAGTSLPLAEGIDPALWRKVNRDLVAKSIGELAYEQALHPVAASLAATVTAGSSESFELELASGVTYLFSGRRGIWDWIAVDPPSVRRMADGRTEPAEDCLQFYLDARAELEASAAALSTYLRELSHTLLADAAIAAGNASLRASDLAELSPDRLQCRLEGHPKAPASKGRLGWGLDDAAEYSPEAEKPFRLVWIAADRDRLRLSLTPGLEQADLVAQGMDEPERRRLDEACRSRGIGDGHVLLPVHPWQWTNMIGPAFAGEVAAGRIAPLGVFGDHYLPQQSLRTLANADRAGRLDVKLPLTILNTSCYRGIPGRFIEAGPVFSRWLARTVAADPLLQRSGTIVLGEIAGAVYPHPAYAQIEDAPYQHHEMLGAIWRESVLVHLAPGETAMMIGALAQRDAAGTPLVSHLVRRSGLPVAAWLARLFEAVAVPLYHFLCRYGVGFIAHGQNVTLVLRDHVPARLALKDLQGDCDLVDIGFPELDGLPRGVAAVLKRRPPGHLVHHLLTAHFVSVLRFVSAALDEHDGFPEIDFYGVLARVLRGYQEDHPELEARFGLFDLFRPRIERVCINRARFRIGYADDAQRPVPILGTDLVNPIHLAEAAASQAASASRIISRRQEPARHA